MARVKVTDPHTGVTLTVNDDSPQAKIWGESSPRAKSEPGNSEPKGSAPARKGRPRKSAE